MKLSIRQSYFAMFHLLDKFYKDTKDDCLGSLMGGFSPYLFADSMTADPAAWGDWESSVKKVTDKELLTPEEAFRATLMFIKFHQEEFGFDLKWLIDELNAITVNSESWSASVSKALKEQ